MKFIYLFQNIYWWVVQTVGVTATLANLLCIPCGRKIPDPPSQLRTSIHNAMNLAIPITQMNVNLWRWERGKSMNSSTKSILVQSKDALNSWPWALRISAHEGKLTSIITLSLIDNVFTYELHFLKIIPNIFAHSHSYLTKLGVIEIHHKAMLS